MKIRLLLFVGFLCFALSKMHAQPLFVSEQDSIEILEKAAIKVMFLEVTLNYLANPFGQSKAAISGQSYNPEFSGRIFLNPDVLVEDDLDPGVQAPADPPRYLRAVDYLRRFEEVYTSEDPKSIKFRVSKIRTLIRTGEKVFAEIFFEQNLGGVYALDTLRSYRPNVYRLATFSVEKVAGVWECYVKEIKFARQEHIAYYVPREYIELRKELEVLDNEKN